MSSSIIPPHPPQLQPPTLQLRLRHLPLKIPKPLKRPQTPRIRHRATNLHLPPPTQDLPHSNLDLLPVNRDRNLWHLHHKAGHVAGAEIITNSGFEIRTQLRRESTSWLKGDEEKDGFVFVVGPAAGDAERVGDHGCEGR